MLQPHCTSSCASQIFRPYIRNATDLPPCHEGNTQDFKPRTRKARSNRCPGWLLVLLLLLMVPSAAWAASVTLSWETGSGSPKGYLIFMRRSGQTYNYDSPAWQGSATTCALSQLQDGCTYYFVVRAYSSATQSDDSNEVQYNTPALSSSQTPVADAGADRAVNSGADVILDGSASRDPNGTITGYQWTQISGKACSLSRASTSRVAFTAPSVTSSTTLLFQLSVTDDEGLSATDTCRVTVVPAVAGDGASDGDATQTDDAPLVYISTTDSDKIWIEAEDGDINTPMQISGDAEASEGAYISVPNGVGGDGDAMFTFTVGESGSYIIWGRVLAPSGNDDSFFVSMDNGSTVTWKTKSASVWAWDKIRADGSRNPVVYSLDAGQHILKIQRREDGTGLDRILITSDTNCEPAGMGEQVTEEAEEETLEQADTDSATDSTQIILETEKGELSSPMRAQNDTTASSGAYIWVPEGEGSVYGPSSESGLATYTFNISESGTYMIWGRVLSATSNDDSFFISVDGQDYIRWNTPVGASWAWDLVPTRNGRSPLLLELAAGTHTLSLMQREDGAKIDKLIITRDSDFVP